MTAEGNVVFHKNAKIIKEFDLPCGQCIGCRLERSRQWAMRCMHESTMHEKNCFITLTYDDENLPNRNSLAYEEWVRFAKRLRKHTKIEKIRFYMCGEYGEQTGRPHYHAIIFGYDWEDKLYHATSPTGDKLYTSEALSKIWGKGHSLIGNVTFESAAYVARYIMKKITGKQAEDHYLRVDELGAYNLEPEFSGMSLKPGIGKTWFDKYKKDVYNNDYVIINGTPTRPPKFYDKILKQEYREEYDILKEEREQEAYENRKENTNERLEVKRQVTTAKINHLKRTIE